jgi:hypothetical protein
MTTRPSAGDQNPQLSLAFDSLLPISCTLVNLASDIQQHTHARQGNKDRGAAGRDER